MFILLKTIETFLKIVEDNSADPELRISLSSHIVDVINKHYTTLQTEAQNRSIQEYNLEYQNSMEDTIYKLKTDISEIQSLINNVNSDDYSLIDNKEIPKDLSINRHGKLSEELEIKLLELEKCQKTLTEYKNTHFYNITQSYDDMREAFQHINDLKSSENRTNQLLSNLNTRLASIETHFEEETKFNNRISPINLVE